MGGDVLLLNGRALCWRGKQTWCQHRNSFSCLCPCLGIVCCLFNIQHWLMSSSSVYTISCGKQTFVQRILFYFALVHVCIVFTLKFILSRSCHNNLICNKIIKLLTKPMMHSLINRLHPYIKIYVNNEMKLPKRSCK